MLMSLDVTFVQSFRPTENIILLLFVVSLEEKKGKVKCVINRSCELQ